MDISSPVSILMYNNFVSSMLLICNPSHNIISPMDLSNNFLSLNNYRTLFLWTSSKKLLLSSEFDIILVIVNWLTKWAIFIPTHNTITSVCSSCVLQTWCFFHVISNRSLEFISNFFCFLGTTLNMWLHFTSGYHPKGNEQTEHMNQTLK